MKSKILFLNPPLSLRDLYKNLEGGGSELPPLGVAILAAITRNNDYETKILDAMTFKLDINETVKEILKFSPTYLAITSTTISIFNAAEVAKKVKQLNPKIITILGGPHITAVPEETLKKFPEFNIGVIGEAEETLPELLKNLDSKKPLDNVKGLLIRKNSSLKFTLPRPFICDLDKLPFPAWDLLPNLLKYYQPAADSLHRSPATLLITSRGCPGQCVFCDKKVFGNKIRGYSADYVINMIKHLISNYKIKDLFIEDDNFLALRPRLKEICNRIIHEKIDITFSIMGRVDMVNKEILDLLKKAGCWQINYGLESGSNKILKILNKNITVEKSLEALKLTKEAGIKIKGLFMIGNYGETRETIQETLDFIKKAPLDEFHMTCFTPFPGAMGYHLADKYGTLDKDWKKVSMFAADNFVPNGFTREEIEKYYRKAWRTFYLRPKIIWYFTKKLKDKNMRSKIISGGLSFLKFNLKNS
ncbi:MAG: B12-binding domain-containing radical SAM protein [Nanoarchaeota archaeon]|nr:B12-binding domain-containing radical SAM protein [Nanoarchaeota archaeon]